MKQAYLKANDHKVKVPFSVLLLWRGCEDGQLTWKERRFPETLTYVPGGRTALSTLGSCTNQTHAHILLRDFLCAAHQMKIC